MDAAAAILVISFIVTFMALLVLFIFLFAKEKKKFENKNIILNFMNQYTDGYSCGLEISTEKSAGREMITYEPLDVDMKDLENNKNIENQRIVADSNFIIPLSYGSLSRRRTIKLILPPSIDGLSPEIRKSRIGPYLAQMILDNKCENTALKVALSSNKVEDKLLMRGEGKQRLNELINLDKDFTEKILEKNEVTIKQTRSPDSYPGRYV